MFQPKVKEYARNEKFCAESMVSDGAMLPDPQPARKDHPWRMMPHHGMTSHISGPSLSAQPRHAAGTREILECRFKGRPIREEYLIVDGGKLAGTPPTEKSCCIQPKP